MKKLWLLCSLFLLSCGEQGISPLALLKLGDRAYLANPSLIESGRNICPRLLSFVLDKTFVEDDGLIGEKFSLGYVNWENISMFSNISIPGQKTKSHLKDECAEIIEAVIPNFKKAIAFGISFDDDDELTFRVKNKVIAINSKDAFMEIKKLGPYKKNDRIIISSQKMDAILDCPDDFELYCENPDVIPCRNMRLKPPEKPCLFAIEKQALEVENGYTILVNLEGRILKQKDETMLEINHISFD